jgi:lysophospholipase L1-like esterase
MSRPLLALAACLIAVLLSACGSSSSDGQQATATATANDSRSATAQPTDRSTPTPAPTPAPTAPPDKPLYIALGDSLSYGNGASDRNQTSFVALVHQALGPGYGLLNLGIPGYTSDDLLSRGELDTALADIQRRKKDGIPGNEVAGVTLEIGGNDLLGLYFRLVIPGTCPTVSESLARPQCVQALQDVLNRFQPNLETILQRLHEADSGIPLFLMTLYNPFSGSTGAVDQLGQLTLEGQPDTPFPEGLNDVIRTEAAANGAHLVDWYPLFLGRSGEYIAQDLIHPNDTGYSVLADAVTKSMRDAGLPVR